MQQDYDKETSIKHKNYSRKQIQNLEYEISHLQENEERCRMLVTGIMDYAVFTVDPEGYVETWNPGAELMKQYKAKEIIGEHFSVLYPLDARNRNEPMDHLREALEKGFYHGEGYRRKKNGDLFLADVYIRPIFKDDVHLGFAKVVSNLDEDKRNEEIIEQRNDEIVQLKDERAMRENFVSTLSHDLRSPLTAAKLNATLIINRVNQLLGNLDRIDNMIRDLLDVNRLHAGEKMKLDRTECDLVQVLRKYIRDSKVMHKARLKLISPESVIGQWDTNALLRVFENLISNAIKYGDKEKNITISIEEKSRLVEITVNNEGDVIPDADLEGIFEQYHRLEHHRDIVGWGLGLALVKGIINQHGGEVAVQSNSKEGTTFTITLPKAAN